MQNETMNSLYPFLSWLVSLVITIIAMPRLLQFCRERGLFDMPNERKVHHNRIPRLGGVLFAPAMLLGFAAVMIVMVWCNDDTLAFHNSTCLLFVALFLIFSIGLIDDLLGMDAKIKFLVQLVASAFMPLCNLYINNLYGFCGIYEIPGYIGYPLTIFISLLVINAINLIDGIDGLASGLGVIILGVFSGIFLYLGMTAYAIFTFGLLGTLTAFMLFNIWGRTENNTKTFMGDTGSLILGYSIAYLCIKYAMFNPGVIPIQECPILLSFTLVIVPTFDLIRVALVRLYRKKGIFTPDKTHLHHLFLATGLNMHKSLVAILSIQIFFDVYNMAMFHFCHVSSTIIVISDVVFYLLLLFALKHFARQEA